MPRFPPGESADSFTCLLEEECVGAEVAVSISGTDPRKPLILDLRGTLSEVQAAGSERILVVNENDIVLDLREISRWWIEEPGVLQFLIGSVRVTIASADPFLDEERRVARVRRRLLSRRFSGAI